jgi:hypothetical protein
MPRLVQEDMGSEVGTMYVFYDDYGKRINVYDANGTIKDSQGNAWDLSTGTPRLTTQNDPNLQVSGGNKYTGSIEELTAKDPLKLTKDEANTLSGYYGGQGDWNNGYYYRYIRDSLAEGMTPSLNKEQFLNRIDPKDYEGSFRSFLTELRESNQLETEEQEEKQRLKNEPREETQGIADYYFQQGWLTEEGYNEIKGLIDAGDIENAKMQLYRSYGKAHEEQVTLPQSMIDEMEGVNKTADMSLEELINQYLPTLQQINQPLKDQEQKASQEYMNSLGRLYSGQTVKLGSEIENRYNMEALAKAMGWGMGEKDSAKAKKWAFANWETSGKTAADREYLMNLYNQASTRQGQAWNVEDIYRTFGREDQAWWKNNNLVNSIMNNMPNQGFDYTSLLQPLATIGSAFIPSSRGLKDNIRNIESPSEKVKNMRGVTFNWKEGGASDGGVIAEELEAIIPDGVAEIGGVKHIKPMMIIAHLIEAVKELSSKVERLEAMA